MNAPHVVRKAPDVEKWRVLAFDPPGPRVRVTDGGRQEFTVYIGETLYHARIDIIVRTPVGVKVVLGHPALRPGPSTHLVRDDDAVLAVVSMPANTGFVLPGHITERRSFGPAA